MKRTYHDRYSWVDEVVKKTATPARNPKPPVLTKKEKRRLKRRQKLFGKRGGRDKFLLSYEWAVARQEALRLAKIRMGGKLRCEACWRGPEDHVTLCVDHIKNRRDHPQLALDQGNLQVLCSQCNWGKSNRHSTDWREEGGPLTNAYRATLAED